MSEMKGLREKEDKELRKILGETRAGLARLLGERASGSKKDSSSSRKKRREVARILTVLQEKEILKQVAESPAQGGSASG
ncbi:MAG: 50S ribosomal protein L29 [candidate division WWE3 bacterium]|nr:50S ribosomal protein L29 [candidate division WWE3 bacterium]